MTLSKESFDDLKIRYAFLHTLTKSTMEKINDFEYEMRKFLEQTTKKFGLDELLTIQVSSSVHPQNGVWDPCFVISHIESAQGGRQYIQLMERKIFININGNWVAHKGKYLADNILINTLDFEQKLTHVDPQKIIDFQQYMIQNTGVDCKIKTYAILDDNGHRITQNTTQILNKHKNGHIVCKGTEPKPWAILRTGKGTYVFYYTTNSFGFGYDQFADSNKKQQFFSWFGDKNVLASIIPEKHRTKIMGV